MDYKHRTYYILEQYWDLWGIVEEEDAYISRDAIKKYADEWEVTVEDLLKQMVEA